MERHTFRGGSCPICQKSISSEYELQEHAEIHNDTRFCNSSSLHEESQVQETRNVSSFNSQVHFNMDMRKFSCDFCETKFEQKLKINDHMQVVHQVKIMNNGSKYKTTKTETLRFKDNHFKESSIKVYETRNVSSFNSNGFSEKKTSHWQHIREPEATMKHFQTFNEKDLNRICSACESSFATNQSMILHILRFHDNTLIVPTSTYEMNEEVEQGSDPLDPNTSPQNDINCKEAKNKKREEGMNHLCLDGEKLETRSKFVEELPKSNEDIDNFALTKKDTEPLEKEKMFCSRNEEAASNSGNDGDSKTALKSLISIADKEDEKDLEIEKERNEQFVPTDFDQTSQDPDEDPLELSPHVVKCQVCGKKYPFESQFSTHMKLKHQKEWNENQCIICQKSFASKNHFKDHVRRHLGLTPRVNCDACGKDFSSMKYLKTHFDAYHLGKKLICESCGKDFSSMKNLKTHDDAYHLGKKRLKCVHCEERFISCPGLNKHIMNDHPTVPRMKCQICGLEFALQRVLNSHTLQTHSNKPQAPIKCKKCDHQEKYVHGLELHMAAEHPESMKVQCDTCGKSWYLKRSIAKHRHDTYDRKIKVDRPRGQCEVCGKAFTSKQHIRAHVKAVHNKEKTFQCNTCGKLFGTEQGLNLHVDAVHIKVRKHQCTYCDESFTLKIYLKSHITFKHTEKAFKCQYCGKDFAIKYAMERHMRIRHLKEKPYSCQICYKKFSTAGNMRIHMKSSH